MYALNFDDNIDWERALPPHIVAQQQREAAAREEAMGIRRPMRETHSWGGGREVTVEIYTPERPRPPPNRSVVPRDVRATPRASGSGNGAVHSHPTPRRTAMTTTNAATTGNRANTIGVEGSAVRGLAEELYEESAGGGVRSGRSGDGGEMPRRTPTILHQQTRGRGQQQVQVNQSGHVGTAHRDSRTVAGAFGSNSPPLPPSSITSASSSPASARPLHTLQVAQQILAAEERAAFEEAMVRPTRSTDSRSERRESDVGIGIGPRGIYNVGAEDRTPNPRPAVSSASTANAASMPLRVDVHTPPPLVGAGRVGRVVGASSPLSPLTAGPSSTAVSPSFVLRAPYAEDYENDVLRLRHLAEDLAMGAGGRERLAARGLRTRVGGGVGGIRGAAGVRHYGEGRGSLMHESTILGGGISPGNGRGQDGLRRQPATTSSGASVGRPTGGGEGGNANDDGWELADFSYEALLELGSMAVSTGLSKKQLERYRPVVLSVSNLAELSAKGQGDCPICLEEFASSERSLAIQCGHTFHYQCIVQWLSRTNKCPVCRFEIVRRD